MKIYMFVEQNKRHHRPGASGNRNQLKAGKQNLSESQQDLQPLGCPDQLLGFLLTLVLLKRVLNPTTFVNE